MSQPPPLPKKRVGFADEFLLSASKIPPLKWSFKNYPTWRRATESYLRSQCWWYTCVHSFTEIANIRSQTAPWTEAERSAQKKMYERDSEKAFQFLQRTLSLRLSRHVETELLLTSAKELIDFAEKKYSQELPAIQKKVKADWANWSLRPKPKCCLLVALSKGGDERKKKKSEDLFVDGFDRLESIWWNNLDNGRRISKKEFFAKFTNGMAHVSDGNKDKEKYITAVSGLLWEEAEPTLEKARAVVRSVKERRVESKRQD